MILLEIFTIITIMFLVLGVHELGHLVTGLAQGFRFELFVVGPLGIKRENDKVKLYLNKEIANYGGLAATIPTSDHPDNSKKLADIAIAGPIASLVLAIILAAVYFYLDFQLSKIILIGAIASLGIFLVTTIPSKTGMFFTDRKRYQRLTTNGPERDVEQAILRVIGNYAKDNSYKSVDKNDIEILISDEHYKYFGLFTKLTYQFETEGAFDEKTKEEFDLVSEEMPKSLVKVTNKQLENLKV